MARKPIPESSPGSPKGPSVDRLPSARTPSAAPARDAPPEDVSIDERLRALGLGSIVAEGWREPLAADTSPSQAPEPSDDPQIAAMRAEIANLSAALAAHRVQLRDAERALVDRIADVDDDRRQTAAQLQRSWQTQREELEARVRRHGRTSVIALLLMAAVAGSAIYAWLTQPAAPQAPLRAAPQTAAVESLAAQVGDLRQRFGKLSDLRTQDLAMEDKIATLSAAVTRLSAALAAPGGPGSAAVGAASAPSGTQSEPQDSAASGPATQSAEASQAPAAATQPDAGAGGTATGAPVGSGGEPQSVPETGTPSEPAPSGTAPGPSAAADRQVESPAAETPGAPAPSVDEAGQPPIPGETVQVSDRPFALQLIGSYNPDDIAAIAARPDMPNQVYQRRETLRGRPWYVLIHSLHPSYDAAQAAVARLPPELAALKPWIRNLPAGSALDVLAGGQGR